MTELKLYGLMPEELEAARESLIALYELRDEYAKAKSKAATITTCQITERKGEGEGR